MSVDTQQGSAAGTGSRRLTDVSDFRSSAAGSSQQWSRPGPSVGPVVYPRNTKTVTAAPEPEPAGVHHLDEQQGYLLKSLVVVIAIVASIFFLLSLVGVSWTDVFRGMQPKDGSGNIVIDIGDDAGSTNKQQSTTNQSETDANTTPVVKQTTASQPEPAGCYLEGVQMSATEVYHCAH